ncbi:MAG: hypothetical protein ACI9WL_001076, partial [Rubritalea sp.]
SRSQLLTIKMNAVSVNKNGLTHLNFCVSVFKHNLKV